MERFNPMTDGGYNMYTMSSMLQKAIRRGDVNHAAFAAKELRGRYPDYLWRRLLVISAEDCYGIITKEIIGLKIADDTVNKGKKGYDRDSIFISKAVLLLCLARKNRDACFVACNFLRGERQMKPEEIPDFYLTDVDEAELNDDIPEWVFDVHTLEGKRRGKTGVDMIRDENEALEPRQMSIFDMADWDISFSSRKANGGVREKEKRQMVEYQVGKEFDPSHNGEDLEITHPEVWGVLFENKVGKIESTGLRRERLDQVVKAMKELMQSEWDDGEVVNFLRQSGITDDEIKKIGYDL